MTISRLHRGFGRVQQIVSELQRSAAQGPAGAQVVSPEAFEELLGALHDLQAAAGELCRQNDQAVAAAPVGGRLEGENKPAESDQAPCKSTASLQAVIDAIPESVVVIDRGHRIVLANRAAREITGGRDPAAHGLTCHQVAHHRDTPCEGPGPACPLQQVLATKAPVTVTHTHYDAQGHEYSAEINAAPIFDQAGQVVQIIESCRDITEQRQAQKALRESEERFRDIAENALEWIWEVDADGRYIYASPVVEKILGYTPEEMLEKRFHDLFHPEDRQELTEAAIEAFARRRSFREFINRNVHKNGTTVWLSTSGVPVLDEKGNLLGYRGADIDITDRKQAEEALRLDESRLTALLRLTQIEEKTERQIADFALDEAVKLTRSRIGWLGFMSGDEEVLTIDAWSETVMRQCALSDQPLTFRVADGGLWAEAVRQRRPIIVNDYHRLDTFKKGYPEGHVPIVRYLSIPAFEGDRIIAVAAVANKQDEYDDADVRQLTLLVDGMWRLIHRKRTQQALRESEERFRTLADFTYDWEYWVGPDGNHVYISPSCERMTGYDAGQFVKDPGLLMRITHPDDRSLAGEHFRTELETGEAGSVEFRIFTRSGEQRWIEHVCQPIYGPDGTCLGRRASNRDITARKRAEQEARRRQAELAHVSRLSTTGEMASAIAHELNQPLCAILSSTQACLRLIRAQAADSDEILEVLEQVAAQAKRAGEIIRRLKDFSRKREPHRSSIDINAIVREAAGFVAAETRPSGVRMQLQLAEGVPHVLGDTIEIEQVIVNLVRNGIEAMDDTPENQRALTIRTSPVGADALEVAICDTGRGLPGGDADRVFEPFFSTRPEGMGIGLSISRSIIETYGGRLWATANPDRGATFRFTLPTAENTELPAE